MLKLLLDEHISPDVDHGLRRRHRAIEVHSMVEWENGHFLGQDDSSCLQEADAQGLTLVTYDRRTIPPLLKTWAEEGRKHGGVVFVDEKTISRSDIGSLVWALTRLAKETGDWDWTNRLYFPAALMPIASPKSKKIRGQILHVPGTSGRQNGEE